MENLASNSEKFPFSTFPFWDTDPNKIEWKKNKKFVIPRIVEYGTIKDWQILKEIYGLPTIKEVMLSERDVNKKVLSFLICIFEVPKESFRCYKERQLHQQHWPY
jgi:hypothetical protein